MGTANGKWDVERAQAWLRRHAWGERGEDAAPALPARASVAAPAAAPESDSGALSTAGLGPAAAPPLEDDEIDIACWPALVAPFYD